MAKFRSGNLILTSTQTIIHGNNTILDATRKGSFNSLELDSTANTVISEFSIDTTLAGNSDTALPTEKAVKTYVDNGLAGLSQNKISQLDSKVEVIDTGSDGYVSMFVDGVPRVVLNNTPLLSVLAPIRAGENGGGIGNTLLVGHYSHPNYGAIFGSMASSIGPMMGYCVKPNQPTFGFLSSNGANIPRSCVELQGDINFWTAPIQTVAVDSPIVLNTVMTITNAGGLKVTGTGKEAGAFYAGATDPTNTTRLNYDGYFYATRVYNAVWNDIADFQDLADPAFYAGKCYYDTIDGAKLCSERCQKSVIGVASDTFGYGVGQDSSKTQVSVAVCGWVLAHVNDAASCVPGDVLTNDADGNLVKMTDQEKTLYPERIVAIYKRKENKEFFGPNDQVVVNGRHWVKVK